MSKYTLGDLTVHHWNDWDRVARDPMTVGLMITQGVGYSTAAALAAVGTWGFGTFAIGLIAVTAVTSWAISALTPKPDFSSLRGLLANTRDATSPQEVVYGEVRKGGVVTFMESTGDKNKYLHQIICLAGHEVNAIGDIYINDEIANPDQTTHLVGGDWNDKIYIRKFLGTSTQNVYGELSGITDGPEWKDGTSGQAGDAGDFKGQGIACLYVRMEYDQDVFAEGIPIFTAKVQGKKVLDPRTSTTAYSNNPALCIRDYLTSNYGLSDTGDINDTMFNAAANACDESVTLADSGSQTRYEMNGAFVLSKTPAAILADMMTSCAGTLFWGQGEWQLKVGEYTTPVKTFTLDDFRSGINLTTKHSRRDNFNIVRGTFIDADQDWVRADYPEIRSTSFISDDNGLENAIDLTLPFTTNSVMAQRLAKMTLFRSREQMTISADFGMEAFEVQVGDIVEITNERYGWTQKDFEVVGWKFSNSSDSGEMLINMTLRETSSAAFDWNAEESDITGNDSDLGDPVGNLTVSGVTVTDKGTVQTDGTFVGQALVSWTQATNKFISHYQVEWKDVDESSYLSTQIEASESSVVIGPLETGTQYDVRVRAATISGVRGTWVAATPYTHGGDTTAPSPITGLTATGGPKNVTLDWTAPTTDSDTTTLYDLKGYNIYRHIVNSQPSTPIAFSGSDKYVDGGLGVNTTYYYWVTAVDFTGNESTSVASGYVVTDDAVQVAQEDTRIYTGKVYYQTLQASSPSTPSASSFNESTLTFSGLTSGWDETQPRVDATSTTVKEWSSKYKVEYDADDNETITFATPDGAFQFTDNIESDNFVSGSAGFRFERDTGDIEVNNGLFRGDVTVQGEIINTTDAHLRAEVGGPFNAITSSATINSLLDGAGAYVFVMVGGGGGGTSSDTDEYETGCGGAGAGCAIFSFEWNGSTSLVFSRGNGGAGGFNAGDGTSSSFSYGGSTLAIARGGDGAIHYQTQSGTASGGTATVYTNVVTLLGYYTRTGGSTSITGGQHSSGGGVDFFGTGDANGRGSSYGGETGGNPWGITTSNPVYSNDEPRTIMGLPVGISYQYNGTTDNSDAWGIQGGHAGPNAGSGYSSYAGNGGPLCGGGKVSLPRGGEGGWGGVGGGGGGSRADEGPRTGGSGGNGVLYWSKL